MNVTFGMFTHFIYEHMIFYKKIDLKYNQRSPEVKEVQKEIKKGINLKFT